MNQDGGCALSTELGQFLEALGSRAPTPGGGAASALTGALAAALAEMVAQLTLEKPKYAEVQPRITALIQQARAARATLLRRMDEDATAYEGVAAAYRTPRSQTHAKDPRAAAIQAALLAAMQPPLRMMEEACAVLVIAREVAEIGNRALASDAGCAALLGQAAVRAAGLNVLANLVLLHEEPPDVRAQMATYESRAAALAEETLRLVYTHMGG